jgi:signal transduction histidine kinase
MNVIKKENTLPPDISTFREHKHNYAPLFQKVVSNPARSILKEWIENPGYFTEEERRKILRMYTDAIELRGKYDMLGKNVDDQIREIKKSIIPQIETLTNFYRDIFIAYRGNEEKVVEPIYTELNSDLQNSIINSKKLLDLMDAMEKTEFGLQTTFNLRKVIDDEFRTDIREEISKGNGNNFIYESFCGDLSDTMVCMDEDGFKINVIGNIISNFHKHAFLDAVENGTLMSSEDDFFNTSKRVKMIFEKSSEKTNYIRVIIKNNGKIFDGDTESVFSWGVGAGSGIGLTSARNFLKHYNASINMDNTIDEEGYTVSFILIIPTI